MKISRTLLASILAASMALGGCAMDEKDDDTYQVVMVTDTGGINDQSFNQTSWKGLQDFHNKNGAIVRYLESKQASDFTTNLDRATDTYPDIVWGIGFSLADSLLQVAAMNPDINFAIVDQAFDETPQNVTGVVFKAEESSFLVGYIAGLSTKTDKVGYVGAMKTFVNDQFEYGFLAGVAYAAAELGKEIEVQEQFTESYSDVAKAKGIANKMFANGCDIVFHSAGGAGFGVIESAKENNQFAIGVDTDQSYLAPDNVLTSGLKNVDVAVESISDMDRQGEEIGGKTFSYGLKENGVGIPENNPNMDPEVYKKAMAIQDQIINGELVIPSTEETYNEFITNVIQK
ncbi:BMP family ABC transporter substrate-binding protein [Erysipelotrichaceae bacterium RD49]|nr:BMP family ABC transporter substrate-binding protein [Erysipelotrichaceae bacterium RD49]